MKHTTLPLKGEVMRTTKALKPHHIHIRVAIATLEMIKDLERENGWLGLSEFIRDKIAHHHAKVMEYKAQQSRAVSRVIAEERAAQPIKPTSSMVNMDLSQFNVTASRGGLRAKPIVDPDSVYNGPAMIRDTSKPLRRLHTRADDHEQA